MEPNSLKVVSQSQVKIQENKHRAVAHLRRSNTDGNRCKGHLDSEKRECCLQRLERVVEGKKAIFS